MYAVSGRTRYSILGRKFSTPSDKALSLSLLFHMSSAPARHICSSSLSFVILAKLLFNIYAILFLLFMIDILDPFLCPKEKIIHSLNTLIVSKTIKQQAYEAEEQANIKMENKFFSSEHISMFPGFYIDDKYSFFKYLFEIF